MNALYLTNFGANVGIFFKNVYIFLGEIFGR